METEKLKVIQDYDKLDENIKEQIKLVYPKGYSQHLIKFKNKNGERVSALRFETDKKIYMVRMSVEKAEQIILKDFDFDDDGILKKHIKDKYQDKHSDVEYLSENDNYEENL